MEVNLVRKWQRREIIVGTMVEITSRRQAEVAMRQASQVEAAAMLAGGVAHSLNNLMVCVLGHAEMLREEMVLRPQAQSALIQISQSATRACELSRQLLAFARGGKFWPRVVNLNNLVRETLRYQLPVFGTSLEVVQELDKNLWPVHADPSQMGQVILNLWTNAREATGGAGMIRLRTENVLQTEENTATQPRLAPGRYVVFSVEDDGCGMDDYTCRRMFEPFFSTRLKGRGLGLAAVSGIVRNHEGAVHVQTQKGEGTCVSVYLPAIAE